MARKAKTANDIKGSPLVGDPEFFALGAQLAAFHLEAGTRKFVDFAKVMAADLDTTTPKLRPYLRAWYNGGRDMMEDNGVDITGIDSPDAVRAALAELKDADESLQNWIHQARAHWREHQPRRFKALKESGKLEVALREAAEQTYLEKSDLEEQWYSPQGAWEMVREKYLFPPKEKRTRRRTRPEMAMFRSELLERLRDQ